MDTGLPAPASLHGQAPPPVASDVYGSSLQAGAWQTPKLLLKEQPSLASKAVIKGTGAHDACSGAIVITGARGRPPDPGWGPDARPWHMLAVPHAARP